MALLEIENFDRWDRNGLNEESLIFNNLIKFRILPRSVLSPLLFLFFFFSYYLWFEANQSN